MTRAITLAGIQDNPFKAAIDSADNIFKLVADLMYGTPKRVEYTIGISMMLFALSFALNVAGKNLLQTCPI